MGITLPLAIYLALAPAIVTICLFTAVVFYVLPRRSKANLAVATVIVALLLGIPSWVLNVSIADQANSMLSGDYSKIEREPIEIVVGIGADNDRTGFGVQCDRFCEELLFSKAAKQVVYFHKNYLETVPLAEDRGTSFWLKNEPICETHGSNGNPLSNDLDGAVIRHSEPPAACIVLGYTRMRDVDILYVENELDTTPYREAHKENGLQDGYLNRGAGVEYARRVLLLKRSSESGNLVEVHRSTLVRFSKFGPLLIPLPAFSYDPMSYKITYGLWLITNYLNPDGRPLCFSTKGNCLRK